jgi:hypothetical protein
MMNNAEAPVNGRNTNVVDIALKIVTVPEAAAPDLDHSPRAAFVKRESSRFLTPQHIDVTDRPMFYAQPKPFAFPTKAQLRSSDANRWVRQRLNAGNAGSAIELLAAKYSINNLAQRPSFRLSQLWRMVLEPTRPRRV